MKNTILILALSLIISGCTPILKVFYGIINANKIREKEQVVNYYSKNDIDTSTLYRPKDEAAFKNVFDKFKRVPEIICFNKKGELVNYKVEKSCNADAYAFIKLLDKNIELNSDSSLGITFFKDQLQDFNGKALNIDTKDGNDYYLFISCARWAGRLNKNHVKVWEADAKANTKAKIKVVKVDLDQIKE